MSVPREILHGWHADQGALLSAEERVRIACVPAAGESDANHPVGAVHHRAHIGDAVQGPSLGRVDGHPHGGEDTLGPARDAAGRNLLGSVLQQHLHRRAERRQRRESLVIGQNHPASVRPVAHVLQVGLQGVLLHHALRGDALPHQETPQNLPPLRLAHLVALAVILRGGDGVVPAIEPSVAEELVGELLVERLEVGLALPILLADAELPDGVDGGPEIGEQTAGVNWIPEEGQAQEEQLGGLRRPLDVAAQQRPSEHPQGVVHGARLRADEERVFPCGYALGCPLTRVVGELEMDVAEGAVGRKGLSVRSGGAQEGLLDHPECGAPGRRGRDVRALSDDGAAFLQECQHPPHAGGQGGQRDTALHLQPPKDASASGETPLHRDPAVRGSRAVEMLLHPCDAAETVRGVGLLPPQGHDERVAPSEDDAGGAQLVGGEGLGEEEAGVLPERLPHRADIHDQALDLRDRPPHVTGPQLELVQEARRPDGLLVEKDSSPSLEVHIRTGSVVWAVNQFHARCSFICSYLFVLFFPVAPSVLKFTTYVFPIQIPPPRLFITPHFSSFPSAFLSPPWRSRSLHKPFHPGKHVKEYPGIDK